MFKHIKNINSVIVVAIMACASCFMSNVQAAAQMPRMALKIEALYEPGYEVHPDFQFTLAAPFQTLWDVKNRIAARVGSAPGVIRLIKIGQMGGEGYTISDESNLSDLKDLLRSANYEVNESQDYPIFWEYADQA